METPSGPTVSFTAMADGTREDYQLLVAALLHDIDDLMAPHSHGELSALILRPYVTERTWWIACHRRDRIDVVLPPAARNPARRPAPTVLPA